MLDYQHTFVHNPDLSLPEDVIPHTPPARFLDGVEFMDMEQGAAHGYWQADTPLDIGHFGITMGVLAGEAVNQLGAYLGISMKNAERVAADKDPQSLGVMLDKNVIRPRGVILPGDMVGLSVQIAPELVDGPGRGKFAARGVARVDGETLSEVELIGSVRRATMVDVAIERAVESRRAARETT